MKVAITGGTGLVGRFLTQEVLDAGEHVTLLGRAPAPAFFKGAVTVQPWRLGQRPQLKGHDLLIHCAFAHVPGRYRGGEGDDPAGFIAANQDGTAALFDAARDAGASRVLFLSSRAVYGDYPDGTRLDENLTPRPDTLYGRVKLHSEQRLEDMSSDVFAGISIRATGVYGPAGPDRRHKWADLFDDFRAGRCITPRRGTEVHGDDLAAAARLLRGAPAGAYNLSDMIVDRHELLTLVAALEKRDTRPPAPSTAPVSQMSTTRIRGLGWRPGGLEKLKQALPGLIQTP